MLRAEILMSIGSFPESLSQAIFVGIINISREIGCDELKKRRRPATGDGGVAAPYRASSRQRRRKLATDYLPSSLDMLMLFAFTCVKQENNNTTIICLLLFIMCVIVCMRMHLFGLTCLCNCY